MRLIIAGIIAAAMSGCTDADKAGFNSLGHRFKVTCYSGDKIILDDVSSGQVQAEAGGSGHYYHSEKDGAAVMIMGQCVSRELFNSDEK